MGPFDFDLSRNPAQYEAALKRHAQLVMWTKGLKCPCSNPTTGQPDTQCDLCFGRGFLYRSATDIDVKQEPADIDPNGRVSFRFSDRVFADSVRIWVFDRVSKQYIQAAFTAPDGIEVAHVQLNTQIPSHSQAFVDYTYNPSIPSIVEGDDIEVVLDHIERPNRRKEYYSLLRIKSFDRYVRGHLVTSRIHTVSSTTPEVVINQVEKDYISVDTSFSRLPDPLRIDLSYVEPIPLLFQRVSEKMKYESAFVVEEAEALMTVPGWMKISPGDLFTLVTSEQVGQATIQNTDARDVIDTIANYFDISKLLGVIDDTGKEYSIHEDDKDVELIGRNHLRWLIDDPPLNYSVRFMYNPTYTSIEEIPGFRSAEDKIFPNRINLKRYERPSDLVRAP